jgi:TolA-binding protein
MFNRHLLVVAGMALAAGTAFAQGTYHEEERSFRQEQRIHDGEANGTITRHEAARLQQQQRQIRRAERRASADGFVSRNERVQIRYLQDRADQSIDRLSTNRRAY